ncbi:hypothetical protein [Tessaracoccus sp. Z1128]
MDSTTAEAEAGAAGGRRGFWGALWAGTRATVGALMGLAPHVMHHIGFLAGAALLTGVLGNTVLYVVGLALSIPLLRRLRRRFGTWKAPAMGMAVFTGLFALSAFVIGPLFNPAATSDSDNTPGPEPAASASASGSEEHEGHHSASPTR